MTTPQQGTVHGISVEEWETFVSLFAFNSVDFVRHVFQVEPDEWQLKVLRDYDAGERRISIVSGHGVGKTTVLAWIIIHHLVFRPTQKTVCTAPTSGQLFDALAAEVKSWMLKLPSFCSAQFEVKSDRIVRIEDPEGSFVSFKTSRAEQPEALAGVHSESVLLVGDEASGIADPIFEAAAGSMSGHNAITVLAGNPVRTSGLFFDTHHKLRGTWKTHVVSCLDSPRVSADFVKDMADRYGVDSNAYRVRVLGLFPKADDDTVIPYELVEAALRRDVQPSRKAVIWGLDPARFGADKTTLCRRRGNVLTRKVEWRAGKDTMEVVGWLKSEYDLAPPDERPEVICVDVIGLGAGIVDRGRELGLPIRGVNVSESPAVKERFQNLRAELWFKAREWFARRDVNIAGDEALSADLVAVRYKFSSNGKWLIEDKDALKRRIGRSPDHGDSLVLTFAVEATVAAGSASGQSWKTPMKRKISGTP